MNEYSITIEEQEFIIKDELVKDEVMIVASQGPKGEQGPEGPAGKDGKDGTDGQPGPKGNDGYTPIKGVDYFTPEDIAGLDIPTKVSDLSNDSGFITNTTNDLTNYYTKTEINNIVGNIETLLSEV